MNSLQIIDAYHDGGLWLFDDARFGLHREPFVQGASEAIDRALARKFPSEKLTRCRIIFSATPMPDMDLTAHRDGPGLDAQNAGCMYRDDTARFWLCPAMCHFFGPQPPEAIHATFLLPGRA